MGNRVPNHESGCIRLLVVKQWVVLTHVAIRLALMPHCMVYVHSIVLHILSVTCGLYNTFGCFTMTNALGGSEIE